MLHRSLNLRRLSFVLFVGEKNHFLTQLPSVQEKLVDTLRNVPSPIVQSEVFLCIRVLLCRLSPHNLTSFWPVILTELASSLLDALKRSFTESDSTAFSTKSLCPCPLTSPRISLLFSLRASAWIYSSLFKRPSSKCMLRSLFEKFESADASQTPMDVHNRHGRRRVPP